MKLYVHPGSPNARKARAVAFHLGLDLEEVVLDMRKGEHRDAKYLAVNPNAKVPALQTDEQTLWESNAIMHALAATKPAAGLVPPAHLPEVLMWQFWETAHLAPATGKLVFQRMFAPQPDAAEVERAEQELARYGAILEARLARSPFLVAGTLTLADFAVASAFTYRIPARIDLSAFPHIERWLQRMDEVAAWRKSAPG